MHIVGNTPWELQQLTEKGSMDNLIFHHDNKGLQLDPILDLFDFEIQSASVEISYYEEKFKQSLGCAYNWCCLELAKQHFCEYWY